MSVDRYDGQHVNSYYAATAHRHARYSALEGDVEVDVCVVGGGLTGLSAALELAQKGLSVGLVEAGQLAWGASGRSGGQAIHGFAAGMDVIAAQVGKDDARRMWDVSIEGLDLIRSRIAEHGIDCDWRDGWLWAAIKPRQADYLRAARDELQRDYGYPTDLVEGEAMRAWIGSDRYRAILVDRRGGHLHPLNYALGIAKAAVEAGVRIFETTRAIRVEHGARPVVHCERGKLRCAHVILAGNCYLGETEPRLHRRIMPVGTYIIATEPLGAERMARLLPQRSAICDTNFVLDYFRPAADHRMLFGGRVSYSTLTPANLTASMHARMKKVFPELADARVAFTWGGFVDITMNRAPDFGRLSSNVYYAQGFSGHGIALTGMAGRLMAEAVAGSASRFDLFARLKHRDFPGGRAFRAPALILATAWYRLRDFL
jgi:gamma-glutamylputrescine oxidase